MQVTRLATSGNLTITGGSFRATDCLDIAGVLTVDGGTLDRTVAIGGTMGTDSVRLHSGIVNLGRIATDGGVLIDGAFRVFDATFAAPTTVSGGVTLSVLPGLTIEGATLTLPTNAQVTVEGDLFLNGATVRLENIDDSIFSVTQLLFDGPTAGGVAGPHAIRGSGEIVMTGSGGKGYNLVGTQRNELTIEAGIAVRSEAPSGVVGGTNLNTPMVINRGLIEVAGAGNLLQVEGLSFSNEGTLKAATNAVMFVYNLINTGALIEETGGHIQVVEIGFEAGVEMRDQPGDPSPSARIFPLYMLAEAVRLLAPLFLPIPAAVAQMMAGLAQSHVTRCQAGGRALDARLLGPVVA